ncbi:hypothetical protein ACX27_14700 [Nostoc piscinale CENA21]|uniref:Uncharacterized protein n=1 Tax=Nostoc piscinale CENA21 TaxID=224013 RepID=A0A0M5MGT1_9NOSO|nr:hypothetical protein [Nostoc piscinale]ALF52968.1 hypothetical protein ACX27_09075 [Nostoc piscinale CENA21]ALF53813.1 hypothetical protein ACX27_14700 [Nostoc piscinale CENA21]
MTQNKDHLLELCRPFLLDLSTAIIESLKFPNEPLYETVEKLEGKTRLQLRDYDNISDLTEIDKIRVLSAIATWMEQSQRPNQP